jgi:hypothetical protein
LLQVHLALLYGGLLVFPPLLLPVLHLAGPFCLDLSALPGLLCTLCALHNGQQQHHGILELTWTYQDSRFDLNT